MDLWVIHSSNFFWLLLFFSPLIHDIFRFMIFFVSSAEAPPADSLALFISTWYVFRQKYAYSFFWIYFSFDSWSFSVSWCSAEAPLQIPWLYLYQLYINMIRLSAKICLSGLKKVWALLIILSVYFGCWNASRLSRGFTSDTNFFFLRFLLTPEEEWTVILSLEEKLECFSSLSWPFLHSVLDNSPLLFLLSRFGSGSPRPE